MKALVDSRFLILPEDLSPYSTSESNQHWLTWGQPPASHYVFRIEGRTLRGQLIEGVHVVSRSEAPTTRMSAVLQTEFDAWEAASDEDLANFENSLGPD